jgi:hypothetical protein
VTVTPTGSVQMPEANLQTPSVALQPTTGTQPIDLQKVPPNQTFVRDGFTYTREYTVTLHPNGPPTVTHELTYVPPGGTPQPQGTPQQQKQNPENVGSLRPQ